MSETYIVRESIINFEVGQLVKRRGEDKEWIVAEIDGNRRVRLFDGVIGDKAHYSDLVTLNAPIPEPDNSRKPWTDKDDAILAECFHLPNAVIADLMKRTKSAIQNRKCILSLERK